MATANGVIEPEIQEEKPVTSDVNGSFETPTTSSLSPPKQENGVPPADLNGKQTITTQIKESHTEGTLERKSRSRETEKDRTNLYLRGLPQQEDYSESDLMAAFHPFGKVVSVKIMTERNPNTSGAQPRTGIGFVRFNTEEEARNALLSLNSKPVMIKGRHVRLEAKYADKQASNIRNSHNTMPQLVPHVGNSFLPHHMPPHKLISYYPTGGNVQELMYFQPEIPRQVNISKSDIDGIARSTECLNLEDQKKSGRLDGSVTLNPYNSYNPNQWSGNPQARFPRRQKMRYPAPCVGPSVQLTPNQRPPHPGHMPQSVQNVNTVRNHVPVQPQSANKNERAVMAIPNYVDPEVLNSYQMMAQQARRHPDAQSHAAGTVVMPQAGGAGGQYATGYSTAVSPPQFYSLPPQNAVPCNQGLPVYYPSLAMQHANGGVDGDQPLQNPGMGQPIPAGATSIPGQSYNMVYSPRGQPQAPNPHAQAAPPPHGVLPHMPTQSTVGTHWSPAELVSGPQGSLSLNGVGRHGSCQIQQPPMAPHQPQQSYGPPNGCVPFQVLMPGSRVYQTMPYPAAAAAAAAVAAACPGSVVHQQPQLQQVACLSDFGSPATAVTHSQLPGSTGPTVESVNGPASKS